MSELNHASVAIKQAAEEIAEAVARIYNDALESKDNEIAALREEVAELKDELDLAAAQREAMEREAV